MRRLYNIANVIFLGAFALLLAGVAVGNFLYGLVQEDESPNRMTELFESAGFGKESSQLEGRSYEEAPELSLETLQSSEFQNSAEQYLSDSIPFRDSALLFNATLQRTGIEMAARPFDYLTYSTYYGSDHIYDAKNDTVTEALATVTPDQVAAYESASEVYNAFAQRHPDLDVVMARVDHTGSSINNPSIDLVSNPVDSHFLTDHFYGLLSDDITVVDGVCESVEESLRLYYRSDHHWNIEGGFTAYEQIVREFGRVPAERADFTHVSFDEVAFYGSYARAGLCLIKEPDVISDYWFPGEGIEIAVKGKERSMDALADFEAFSEGDISEEPYMNRYSEYFHYDVSTIEFHNEQAPEGTLLIVSDSFSNPIERYFALNYRDVIVIDPRHTDLTADELIAERGVDDVLIIFSKKTIIFEEMLTSLS